MANSVDPDQLASLEANWSGSTLFAKQGISGFSRTRVNKELSMSNHKIIVSKYGWLLLSQILISHTAAYVKLVLYLIGLIGYWFN